MPSIYEAIPEKGCCMETIGERGTPEFRWCGSPVTLDRLYCEAHLPKEQAIINSAGDAGASSAPAANPPAAEQIDEKPLSLEDLKNMAAEIVEVDHGPIFDASLFLLSALQVGPHAVRISKYSGIDRRECVMMGLRCRYSKIFGPGWINVKEWFSDDNAT